MRRSYFSANLLFQGLTPLVILDRPFRGSWLADAGFAFRAQRAFFRIAAFWGLLGFSFTLCSGGSVFCCSVVGIHRLCPVGTLKS